MPADSSTRPGPWLVAIALATIATLAAVTVTGDWGSLPHYGAVLIGLVLLITACITVWFAHRARPRLVALWFTALAVYLAQIATGGLVRLAEDATWASTLHLVAGAGAMLMTVLATVETITPQRLRRPQLAAPRWRDYITLTKPRIMVLLLLTAVGGMFVGAQGVPELGLLFAMLGGLALACGGASALNHVLDRDIDLYMKRTDKRPVATGRIAVSNALEFGLALSAFSFVILASFTNVLTATLAVFGGLFYVLVYTRWLKRTTPQNIVIGGAAGAIPPVVGYAAATGNLALPALFLFLIVFVWTPPHFWALALLIKREYAAAGVPMLPVVKGDAETARAIFKYSLVMVPVTLLPVLTGTLEWLYLVVALVLGAVFLMLSVRLLQQLTPQRSRRLFTYSLAYLALLFVAMAIDPIILS